MYKSFVFLLTFLILISFVSAQLGYNNPRLPKITSPTIITTTSTGGAGSNVTSVTSSTNCITVDPTTNDVILTFNTSCSASSQDTWWRINNTGLINNTGYLDLNYTSINNSIRIKINEINSSLIYTTHNQTYFNFLQNLSTHRCQVGLVMNGTYNNGTPSCVIDANSGGVISNASLNAIYLNLSGTNANQNVNIGIYNHTANWFKGLFNWIIGANPSQRYLIFNGSTLEFNESNLNSTIDNRRVNIFNQNLNTTDTVLFKNVSAENISSTDTITGRYIRLNNSQSGVALPLTSFEVTTVPVSIFGVTLIRMRGASGSLGVGGMSNGLYLFPETSTTVPQLVIANNTFTGNWVFEQIQSNGNMSIFAQNGLTGANITNKDIVIPNNRVYFRNNITLENNAEIKGEGGRLMFNSTAGTGFTRNNSIIYYHRNLQRWVALNVSPADSQSLTYCNSVGLTWLDIGGGEICPI